MRAMNETKAMQRTMRRMAVPGRHEMMLRRAANHNVHVMTAHGRIFAGRKGRKG
jgi:hypothetical protein